ncbi:MAG TPA: hypothetical protein PLU30_20060 [Verrucomicrobiae bacterium]|nr:hypothetical protein [Verrucomicrobiae bacterium]
MTRSQFSDIALRLLAVMLILIGVQFGLSAIAAYQKNGVAASMERAKALLDQDGQGSQSASPTLELAPPGQLRMNGFLALSHLVFGALLFIAVPMRSRSLDFGLHGDFLPFHAASIVVRATCVQAALTGLLQVAALFVYGSPDPKVFGGTLLLMMIGRAGIWLVICFALAPLIGRILTVGMNNPNQAIEGTAK